MNVEKFLRKGWVPDLLIRAEIRRRLAQKLREEREGGIEVQEGRLRGFIRELKQSPIALNTREANEQHYELPTAFFQAVLGARLKYSSALWPDGVTSLDEAEERMLNLYVERARLTDGQTILELGCGWGSFTLFLAEKFPGSNIMGVSNSKTQREWIESKAAERNLKNVRIVTADMNEFTPDAVFDRVVSIEMFEHMRNYAKLLERVMSWLKPEGLLFLHIFCHRQFAYPYEVKTENDWMARYFFTGGIMPSADLLLNFQSDAKLVERWAVDGKHYQKTCEAWLRFMDQKKNELRPLFDRTYGGEADLWFAYWRIFFMACAELFGFDGGSEWYVSHYLFEKQTRPAEKSAWKPEEDRDIARS